MNDNYKSFDTLNVSHLKASHAVVGRAATTFWYDPVNVLAWIFDIASFAVDAILSIDLELFAFAVFGRHVFVHS